MAIRAPDYNRLKYWEHRLRCTRAFPTKGESHSARYYDDKFEYKHVTLTKEQYHLYREALDRSDGLCLKEEFILNQLKVRQTPGWEHYYVYPPNPQILCLRRPLKHLQEKKDTRVAKEPVGIGSDSDATI